MGFRTNAKLSRGGSRIITTRRANKGLSTVIHRDKEWEGKIGETSFAPRTIWSPLLVPR